MVFTYEDIKVKNLQRYHLNKQKYNERQKEYYRNVYYVANKEKLCQRTKNTKRNIIKVPVVIEQNVIVSFN